MIHRGNLIIQNNTIYYIPFAIVRRNVDANTVCKLQNYAETDFHCLDINKL